MLLCTELVRDVLCNELLQVNAALRHVPDCEPRKQALFHVQNMSDILVGCDFTHVDVDAWTTDMSDIANAVVEANGHELWEKQPFQGSESVQNWRLS